MAVAVAEFELELLALGEGVGVDDRVCDGVDEFDAVAIQLRERRSGRGGGEGQHQQSRAACDALRFAALFAPRAADSARVSRGGGHSTHLIVGVLLKLAVLVVDMVADAPAEDVVIGVDELDCAGDGVPEAVADGVDELLGELVGESVAKRLQARERGGGVGRGRGEEDLGLGVSAGLRAD